MTGQVFRQDESGIDPVAEPPSSGPEDRDQGDRRHSFRQSRGDELRVVVERSVLQMMYEPAGRAGMLESGYYADPARQYLIGRRSHLVSTRPTEQSLETQTMTGLADHP